MPVMRDTSVSAEITEADLSRDMGVEFSDLIQRICSGQKPDLACFCGFSGNLCHFTPQIRLYPAYLLSKVLFYL